MENCQLPAELQQLERDLGNRTLPGSSANLRQTVLADVRIRLRAERSRSRWQFTAAVAAAALLWMNLSLSATQATDVGFRLSRPSQCHDANAGPVQRPMPWLIHQREL